MSALPALVAALAFASVASAAPVQRARYLMGTTCVVLVSSSRSLQDIDAAFAEAKRIEGMLSTWTDESELARLNRGDAEARSEELQHLLGQVFAWSQRTGGAFDPRVLALVELWKLREDGALPPPGAIVTAMRDDRIEEGAFGKGYALDRMLERIAAPEALINFGGQIAVRGSSRVTVADPRDRDRPVLSFTLANASLSTSSGSEKHFTVAGRTFSHILDPRTGEALPPRGSVSVIAPDALTADILSTALYVMGEDAGMRWADANGVSAIFINQNNLVRPSARAREALRDLELLDRRFSMKD